MQIPKVRKIESYSYPPPPLPSNMKPKLNTLLEQYDLTSSTQPPKPPSGMLKEIFTTSKEKNLLKEKGEEISVDVIYESDFWTFE